METKETLIGTRLFLVHWPSYIIRGDAAVCLNPGQSSPSTTRYLRSLPKVEPRADAIALSDCKEQICRLIGAILMSAALAEHVRGQTDKFYYKQIDV